MTSKPNGTNKHIDWEVRAEIFCQLVHLFKDWFIRLRVGLYEIEVEGDQIHTFDERGRRYHYFDLADPECFEKLREMVTSLP